MTTVDFDLCGATGLTHLHCRHNLSPMKPAIYLTDPKEMLKARLNQPRATSEQLRRQRERLKLAAEKFFAAARKETSSHGQRKMSA